MCFIVKCQFGDKSWSYCLLISSCWYLTNTWWTHSFPHLNLLASPHVPGCFIICVKLIVEFILFPKEKKKFEAYNWLLPLKYFHDETNDLRNNDIWIDPWKNKGEKFLSQFVSLGKPRGQTPWIGLSATFATLRHLSNLCWLDILISNHK